jgi:hypothetical protein
MICWRRGEGVENSVKSSEGINYREKTLTKFSEFFNLAYEKL